MILTSFLTALWLILEPSWSQHEATCPPRQAQAPPKTLLKGDKKAKQDNISDFMKIWFSPRREAQNQGSKGANIDQKSMPKRLQDQSSLQHAPRTVKNRSREAQERPRRLQDKFCDEYLNRFGPPGRTQEESHICPRPFWRVLGAKMTPRALQDPSENDFGSICEASWEGFWMIFLFFDIRDNFLLTVCYVHDISNYM